MAQHPRTTSTGSDMKSSLPSAGNVSSRGARKPTSSFQEHKNSLQKELSLAWDGDGWLPPDVRSRCTTPIPYSVTRCIERATIMAQSQGIQLALLWAPGGLLRLAFDGSDQALSSDFCALVHSMIAEWDWEARAMAPEIKEDENYSELFSLKGFEDHVPRDLAMRVQQDIDSTQDRIYDACNRKSKACWSASITRVKMLELDGLFHNDGEDSAFEDAAKKETGAKSYQDDPIQRERKLLAGHMEKAENEAQQAKHDSQKHQKELETLMRTIYNLNTACIPLPQYNPKKK